MLFPVVIKCMFLAGVQSAKHSQDNRDRCLMFFTKICIGPNKNRRFLFYFGIKL